MAGTKYPTTTGNHRVEPRDVFKRLAKDIKEEPALFPIALLGITRGLVEVVLIPAVQDLGHRLLDRTVEPWDSEFFDT